MKSDHDYIVKLLQREAKIKIIMGSVLNAFWNAVMVRILSQNRIPG